MTNINQISHGLGSMKLGYFKGLGLKQVLKFKAEKFVLGKYFHQQVCLDKMIFLK
jgi:hypothetical protein